MRLRRQLVLALGLAGLLLTGGVVPAGAAPAPPLQLSMTIDDQARLGGTDQLLVMTGSLTCDRRLDTAHALQSLEAIVTQEGTSPGEFTGYASVFSTALTCTGAPQRLNYTLDTGPQRRWRSDAPLTVHLLFNHESRGTAPARLVSRRLTSHTVSLRPGATGVRRSQPSTVPLITLRRQWQSRQDGDVALLRYQVNCGPAPAPALTAYAIVGAHDGRYVGVEQRSLPCDGRVSSRTSSVRGHDQQTDEPYRWLPTDLLQISLSYASAQETPTQEDVTYAVTGMQQVPYVEG